MTYEPEHCRSVSICAPKPADEGKTLAQYQADLVRRFGRVPSWPELAKRENAARWNRNPVSTMARQQAKPKPEPISHAKRQEAVAEARRRILEELAEPMTITDLSHKVGMSERGVRNHINDLFDEGRVVRFFLRRCAVWRLKEDAPAKGVSPEPVTVTVRGQEFPSLRACAKHFGISVQAVHDAVRRGSPDKIGMRKMEAAQ